MAKRIETAAEKKAIEQYDHKGKKRVNNPPVGLVDAEKIVDDRGIESLKILKMT
jgi:hypothetical protein